MLIKDVSYASSLEVAYSGIDGSKWFYDRNRSLLKKEVESNLFGKRLIKVKEVK